MQTEKLPLLEIIKRVVSIGSNNIWPIVRIGLPVICCWILELVINRYYGNVGLPILLPFLILQFLAYAMAIVGIHRIFLLPAAEVINTPVIRWSMRETSWIGWMAAMGVLFFVFFNTPNFLLHSITGQLGATISWAVTALTVFCSVSLIVRCSLVFPSVSVDGRVKNLRDSWRVSRGNAFRLFVLLVLIPVFTGLVTGTFFAGESIFTQLFAQFMSWTLGVLEIGLLSHSYAFLTRNRMNEDGTVSVEM